MASDILVDSNVFIVLLKRGRDPASLLLEWAGNRNLATCGMVRLEVLRGITLPKSHRNTSAFFDVMINVPSSNRLWEDAAELAWKLDRKGTVIPGTDVVIAASAMRLGAAILTSDRHFQHIPGLEVISPPAEWLG
jgi:predicted nucleic acid-binding protein